MQNKRTIMLGFVAAAGVATATAIYVAGPPDNPCAPSDGIDDTTCLQAQLDAACADGAATIHLAPGVWNVSRPADVPGSRDNASLWCECGLTLEGSGRDATTIMMTGDGLGLDWAAVRVASKSGAPVIGFTLQDLTVASDDSSHPNEQTHLVYLGSTAQTPGAIDGATIRRVNLRHPIKPDVSGDCLRFVGETATPITRTTVEDVEFQACDRSGLAIQRGVQGMTLRGLHFVDIGKTAIDLEPSGHGPIRDIDAEGLAVDKGGVSLCGQGDELATNISVRDSTVHGGLGTIYASGVTLEHVTVDGVRADDRGALNLRASDHVTVIDSDVRRLAGSVPGAALRLVGQNGIFTNAVEVRNTSLTSEVNGDVVSVESAQNVTLDGDRFWWAGATPGTYYGVTSKPAGQDVANLHVSSGQFSGALAGEFKLSGGPLLIRAVQLLGNTGPALGLRCENPSKISSPVVQGGGYLYGGPATAGCTGVTVVAQWP